MTVSHIEDATEFEKLITGDKLVVVDFFAVWCGPCKIIAPKMEQFSNEYKNATFVKVDVDNMSDLAAKHGITAMPTFQFFKSGKKLAEIRGADAGALERKIKELI